MAYLMQEGVAPISLLVEHELHRATPGGTGGVKTIGNYAAVSTLFFVIGQIRLLFH